MRNEITIHGYLGGDPELKEMQGQNGPYKRVSFSVGVSRDFGDETDWFSCSLSGKRAEALEKFFKKGAQILLWGSMRSYKKKDGSKGWILDADGFDFCDKSNGSGSTTPAAQHTQPAPVQNEPTPDGFNEIDEDIPF